MTNMIQLFALASSAVMIVSCHFGFGKHVKLLSPGDKLEALRVPLPQLSNSLGIHGFLICGS